MAATFKIVLAVSGIFIAGAVTGGFAGLGLAEYRAREARAQQRFGPTEIGGRLAAQLQLTEEQKEVIRPIMNRTSEALRKVRRESFSQTAAIIDKMDADLAKVLTAEQKTLLKDIRAREEERRKKWMSERAKRNEQSPPPRPGEDGPPSPPMPPERAP
jgi:Spy/CpxP family protein refolding chaperone